VATGLSNAEIGETLGIAAGTVKVHVNALLPKLGARPRAGHDRGLRPRPRAPTLIRAGCPSAIQRTTL
jgi:regulatory LuxR family protein